MKLQPKISDAEWEIMKLLWASHPQTANALVEALEGAQHWKPKTIKTLINRLLTKGAIGFKKTGRQYQYYPLVAEQTCIQSESQSFLKRVFNGAAKPMLAAMIENDTLSLEDIDELKQILKKRK
ncbi:MAG: BlaI/MecI/CopY family transcriptional regulator [Planctomycetes bacterium]|nr:BlaI/MecI/CopY family transcriptional regulator [Planctomycetota bacterium]